MKNIYLVAFFLLTNLCLAQVNKGENIYVEVPDRFEFVTGDNTYKLSDMMVFYFEKKGIKAYRDKDSPNVAKCNTLFADIEKVPGIIFTKLIILLKDCNNNVVFKSKAGKTKVKLYEKAFPDALRMAFKTFEKNDINLPETNNEKKTTLLDDNTVKDKIEVIEPQETPKVSEFIVEKEITPKTIITPVASISNYTLNENTYLLKKVTTGFTLFLTKDGNDDFIKVGDIRMGQDGSFTMMDLYGENKTGYFNEEQDIVVELSNGKQIVYVKEL